MEPHLAHAYWEFAFRQTSAAASPGTGTPGQGADDRPLTRPVLRLFEVTGTNGEEVDGAGFLDVEIDLAAGSRYIQLAHPDRSYLAELGFKAASGRFFPAVRSNVITTPRAEPLPEETDQGPSPPLIGGGDMAYRPEGAAPAGPGLMPAATAPAGLPPGPLRPIDCWLPPALAAATGGHGAAGQAEGACPRCSIAELTLIEGLGPISPAADGGWSGETRLPHPDLTALSEQGFVSGISSK